MLIVTVLLGVCLLYDRTPDGVVLTKASEHGSVLTTVPARGDWKEVVDVDGGWDSEGVHVDAVDASRVETVIEHQVRDPSWDFSHRTDCGENPAVSNTSLVDVSGLDV